MTFDTHQHPEPGRPASIWNDPRRGLQGRACRFGAFRLDLVTGELRRHDGAPVPLRPQATRVLRLLVSRRQSLVRREELRRELWGDAATEWEPGIHQVIRQLRRALDDDARDPTYIETVPRRGYRFKAEVEEVEDVEGVDDEVAVGLSPPALFGGRGGRQKRSRDLLLFLGGIVTLPLLLVLACFVLAV